jgi:hypothetical protein
LTLQNLLFPPDTCLGVIGKSRSKIFAWSEGEYKYSDKNKEVRSMRQIYAYGMAEKLLQNPELALDFDGGRISLKKIEKELREYSYSLKDIDVVPVMYIVIDKLLDRQRGFVETPEVIIDFGCGCFAFERCFSIIPESIWYSLLILKGENRIHQVKLATDSLFDSVKFLYGNEAVEKTVVAGTVWKKEVPVIGAVYSNYYNTYINTAKAVRVYNDNTKSLDWIYEEDSLPAYYPKGFKLIDGQAVWVRYKGYIPKSESAYSKFLGQKVWKNDPDLVFTGDDYIPREIYEETEAEEYEEEVEV